MQTTKTDDSALAAATWEAAAGQPRTPQQDAAYTQYMTPVNEEWKWGWNWFIGLHYGPIPVGLIIAVPLLLMMRS